MPINLFKVEIRHEHDVVVARQRARQAAAALMFDSQDQTRIATAVSEVARNAFQYAAGGTVDFSIDAGKERVLSIAVRDKGRGIQNLHEILDGRYESRTGMGLGLIGAKRLMDLFHVETAPGKGTTVTLGKAIPARLPALDKKHMEQLLATLEARSPESPYEEVQQQNRELVRTLEQLGVRQTELAQLNRELDETNRGVVALYAELNDKADFLQRASELKSHFLSNMSHEFRTPLNSILALSRILLDRVDGDLSGEQEKQVRYIRSSAEDLMELVNDLLDLAKVEAGKVTIRPASFDVTTFFAALRGMLRPLLTQNSSVKLVFDEPEEHIALYTDEAKVSQILRNFISNALKFTERGEVRVSVSRNHDNTLAFSVADTGIGISEEDQERIFLEWSQVEGRLQKAAKGSGLGLPLSRKLAQLLGGNVYVRSQLGVGSTFVAVIPRNFKGETEVVYVPDVKVELDAHKLPVLVVEDSREALFVYEKYLKGSRFQVIPAKNVKEAGESLRSFHPVAIVLDVLLQSEHSWDLLREIKQDPALRQIPVFVVTVVDNQQKALALGADGFHPKPVDRAWLLDRLQAAAAEWPRVRVLVIDDDETSRYLVKGVLVSRGCEVFDAPGGRDGLRMAREEKPSLIVLDLLMPDLDGYQVLEELHQDPATRDIPVIVCTSQSLSQEEQSRLSAAFDIIPKSMMATRDLAAARFGDTLQKAGLTVDVRTSSQAVEAH